MTLRAAANDSPTPPAATWMLPTRGYPEFPQGDDGTRWTVDRHAALGNARCSFLRSRVLALEPEPVSVVHQPIEQRPDDHHDAEQLGPVLETTVRGEDGRGLFVAARQHVGRFVAGADGQLAHLAELARLVDVREQRPPLAGGHRAAAVDREQRQRLGDAALARAGLADDQCVLARVDRSARSPSPSRRDRRRSSSSCTSSERVPTKSIS